MFWIYKVLQYELSIQRCWIIVVMLAIPPFAQRPGWSGHRPISTTFWSGFHSSPKIMLWFAPPSPPLRKTVQYESTRQKCENADHSKSCLLFVHATVICLVCMPTSILYSCFFVAHIRKTSISKTRRSASSFRSAKMRRWYAMFWLNQLLDLRFTKLMSRWLRGSFARMNGLFALRPSSFSKEVSTRTCRRCCAKVPRLHSFDWNSRPADRPTKKVVFSRAWTTASPCTRRQVARMDRMSAEFSYGGDKTNFHIIRRISSGSDINIESF
jgi:hypothetical protein